MLGTFCAIQSYHAQIEACWSYYCLGLHLQKEWGLTEKKMNDGDGDKPSWHRACEWWMAGGLDLSVTPANIVLWAFKGGLSY